ncbi:MAG: glycosyltransferase [Bacteroidota bacterium]
MNLNFSIIIPVFNRPQEIDELLKSLTLQTYSKNFEVIVIEDGSTDKSELIVKNYQDSLDVKYFFKANSGPGQSRNYGMERALGNYFIILDSDVLLPENYLSNVNEQLDNYFTDAYGGADAALPNFTQIQKAINYAMTSFLTTGGLRGSESKGKKFQLRSFNLGLSKKSFEITGGFSKQHFGEDIDLTFRLWENNLSTQFIKKAFVFHKRRTSFKQFYQQTLNFGAARPILNKKYPKSNKLTFWFPSIFIIFTILSLIFTVFGNHTFTSLLFIYLFLILIDASIKNKNMITGFYSVFATIVQFFGYGLGFLRSTFRLSILNNSVEEVFPKMFKE